MRWWVLILTGLLAGREMQGAESSVPAWTLVWAEEFSDPGNTGRPDSARWSYDLGGGGWGNNELQTYTARRENARIEDGHLVLEARRETYTGTDGRVRNYTSARIKTQGKASWTYGRMEARIRIPRGQGLWPAFWMLGANFTSVGWPTCGEIDIMESVGREPSKVYGTIHGPGYSGGGNVGGTLSLSDGERFADDFHLFAVEWEPDRIRWLVDNEPYFAATPDTIPAGRTWVFTRPQFIILNVAVGGDFPGNPTGATPFPQRMMVDYVRVYRATELPPPRLTVERTADVVRARWPLGFPQAGLERLPDSEAVWSPHPTQGIRVGAEFVTEVPPGIYRLRWNP